MKTLLILVAHFILGALMALVVLAGVVLLASTVEAQAARCGPTPLVRKALIEGFGEVPQGLGLTEDGVIIETWASLATGTWTVIATLPNGLSCHVASGDNYEDAPAAPETESF